MSETLLTGQVIGHYQVERLLGKGGMGEVYLVRHSELNTLRAMKVIRPGNGRADDPLFQERFLREAKIAARLHHPGIVEVYDVGQEKTSGFLYLVMEYVNGDTIADILKNGELSEVQALQIIRELADALNAASSLGLVHRDIKPSNVMISQDGEVKLADMGIAKLSGGEDVSVTLTMKNAMIGTAAYASPEQLQDAHNTDTRSDIYSLGATLFEMLTCQAPFSGSNSFDTMAHVLKDPVPDPVALNPAISQQTASLIRRMLAKDPAERPQNAAELLLELDALLTGSGANSPELQNLLQTRVQEAVQLEVEKYASGITMQFRKKRKKERFLWVAACIFPVLILAVFFFIDKKFNNREKEAEKLHDKIALVHADTGKYSTLLAELSRQEEMLKKRIAAEKRKNLFLKMNLDRLQKETQEQAKTSAQPEKKALPVPASPVKETVVPETKPEAAPKPAAQTPPPVQEQKKEQEKFTLKKAPEPEKRLSAVLLKRNALKSRQRTTCAVIELKFSKKDPVFTWNGKPESLFAEQFRFVLRQQEVLTRAVKEQEKARLSTVLLTSEERKARQEKLEALFSRRKIAQHEKNWAFEQLRTGAIPPDFKIRRRGEDLFTLLSRNWDRNAKNQLIREAILHGSNLSLSRHGYYLSSLNMINAGNVQESPLVLLKDPHPCMQHLFKRNLPLRAFILFQRFLLDEARGKMGQRSGYSLFYIWSKKISRFSIQSLLLAGADPDLDLEDGMTLLSSAAAQGENEIISDLLCAGADPVKPGKDGKTPLDHAVLNGEEQACSLIKAAIAAAGGNLKISAPSDRDVDTGIFRRILRSGNAGEFRSIRNPHALDLKGKLHNGKTPLEMCVLKGNLEMAKFLLENGADPDGGKNVSLLMLAVVMHNTEMFDLLIAYNADPARFCETTSNGGCNTFDFLLFSRKKFTLKKEAASGINQLNRKGMPLLFRAPMLQRFWFIQYSRGKRNPLLELYMENVLYLKEYGLDLNQKFHESTVSQALRRFQHPVFAEMADFLDQNASRKNSR